MDYKDTDKEIGKLQQEIEKIQKSISDLRKNRALELFEDYTLYHRDATPVLFSSLFKDQEELLVIHNMGKSCSYCTMWADTLNSATTIINDRVPMVLVSPNEPAVLNEFASSRDWKFLCVSAHGTKFIGDSGYSYEKECKIYYNPGVSAFVKKEGKLYRSNKDYFGPGDVYCSPWHFFDLLSKKDNGWTPKFEYVQQA
jgi:predicted dithiol-disulfide oxidoreductase (DUF899 family)